MTEKVRIVRDYLKGKISLQAGAREVGVDHQTLKSWIGIYENYGAEGFTRRQNRVYSAEVKTTAVIDYLNGGGSLQTICKKYGIQNKRQLLNWVKVYNAHGDFNSVKNSGGESYMKQGRDTTKDGKTQHVFSGIKNRKFRSDALAANRNLRLPQRRSAVNFLLIISLST